MSKALDVEKYENAILYICQELGGSVVGKKKLYKLLYYVDFDRFEYKESMHSLTGERYQAWKMGPVPQQFERIEKRLLQSGKLKHEIHPPLKAGYYPTEVYTASVPADESVFDDDEKFILNRVVKKYGHLTGKELELLTHAEAPYIATPKDEEITYELAFYRGTDFCDTLATQ